MNFKNKAARQDYLLKQEIEASGVTMQPAPVIAILDPADSADIQAAFDAVIATLKAAGVLIT